MLVVYADLAYCHRLLPRGYKLFRCCNNTEEPCGCFTALKTGHVNVMPPCKVHGLKADKGAEDALNLIVKAGYCGPVVTQFPLYTEPGKNVSRALPSMNRTNKGVGKRKGGVFSKGTMKVDIMLSSGDNLAAVEVQGLSHNDPRNKHRDAIKAAALHKLGKLEYFEMHACEDEYKPRGGRGRNAQVSGDMLTHRQSKAEEIMKHLRGTQ